MVDGARRSGASGVTGRGGHGRRATSCSHRARSSTAVGPGTAGVRRLPPGMARDPVGRVARGRRRARSPQWRVSRSPDLDAEPAYGAGEAAAHARLERLVAVVDDYARLHEELTAPGASELSVALHFGTISPREIVETVRDAGPSAGSEAFVRQLAWRDWFAHLLAEEPSLTDHALRPELDAIEWRDDPGGLRGVDPGAHGLPARRCRDARAGGDRAAAQPRPHGGGVVPRQGPADRLAARGTALPQAARSTATWPRTSGTGSGSPAPVPTPRRYFRVFNPVTQSRTHDPDGDLPAALAARAGRAGRSGRPRPLGARSAGARRRRGRARRHLGRASSRSSSTPAARARALAAHRVATSARRV